MVGTQQVQTAGPTRYMQGIAVPQESVDPTTFMARTRRKVTNEYNKAWAGFGGTDNVEFKKSDIIAAIQVRLTGTLVVTPGTGTVSSTQRWPYDALNSCRFTANGQSNLINVSGLKLKAHEVMAGHTRLDDRGVAQSFSNSTFTSGTFSLNSESWGVGSGQSAIGAGSYPVDLVWWVPVAEDEYDLHGAIFAQTSSTDLTLDLLWELLANLFTLTGNATVALNNAKTIVDTVRYSIPLAEGHMIVPDLSVFHGLIQSTNKEIGTGPNEYRSIGQGAGKNLLRIYWQTWNGNAPQTILPVNDATYGETGYRYGANETPDDWFYAQSMRYFNERTYNSDIGGVWGFRCLEYAASNAFRDVVDLGTTPDYRILDTIQSTVSLTGKPVVEYVQETIFAAGQGA